MASKRRLRKNACLGKIRHRTAEDAQIERVKAMKRGVRGLNVYYCKYCNGYHVGHKPGWVGR